MRVAAGRTPVGEARDPLPEGVDLSALIEMVEAVRQSLDPPPRRTGGRAALRRRSLKVFKAAAARDAAVLAALDEIVGSALSINHLLGSQSALLAEHEERLRAAEVRAREAELRAPLPDRS
jgi:hypothetical protein